MQLPQAATSVAVSTQALPQAVSPPGHVHTPATQLCPPWQESEQMPQLELSVCRSTHPEGQLLWPAGQVQTPLTQVLPALH